MKFLTCILPCILLLSGLSANAQFSVVASSVDPCVCSGSINYQSTSSQGFAYTLFDINDTPIESAQNQSGSFEITGLCPSVFHIVVEYTDGTIEDQFLDVPAGANSIGDAHRVILCQEAYTDANGLGIPFDLTPELSDFDPGGVWRNPDGLIIPDADLSALSASQMESGWYSYTINSGGCEMTSGIYIQTNDVGLTTTYVICETYEPFEMLDFMQGTPDTIGQWYDSNLNVVADGMYYPATMDDALFTYLIADLPGCQPVFRTLYVDEQTQRSAGTSAEVLVCQGGFPFNMLNLLEGEPDDGGVWTGPAGMVVPAGSDIFNPSFMPQGAYAYTINSAAPCSTQISTLTISLTPTNPSGLSASTQVCATSGGLNMMEALNGAPLIGGTWTNSLGEIVDGIFDPATEPGGNYQYYYPNAGCSPDNSVLSISVEAPVYAGGNNTATICQLDPDLNLNSLLTGTASNLGVWLNNGTPTTSLFNPSEAGSFNFVYQVNAQTCPDDQANFTIFVQPAVAAPLSQNIFLCSTGPEVDLTNYFGQVANVYFESQNGSLLGNLFNPSVETSTTLRVINPSGNTCPDQEGELVINVLDPIIENTLIVEEVCRNNSSFNLNNLLPAAAVGMGSWQDINGNPHSNMVTIDFLGTQSFIYEVIQPIDCGEEQLQVDLVTFTPNDAGADAAEVFCYTDDPQSLDNLLPQSESGAGQWYHNGSEFSSSVFDPGSNSSGTYIYRIAPNGPCPADEAILSVNVQLGINFSAGSDVHVCAGSPMQSIGGMPAAGATYSWSPQSGLNDPSSPQPTVNIPAAVNQISTVIYSVIVNDGVCIMNDFVSVIVEPNPVINLDPSYDLCFGESLSFNNAVDYPCIWTPVNLFNNPNDNSPTIQPTASVYIGVQASSDFGCTSAAFSQVNVNPLPILITETQPIVGCQPLRLQINPSEESQHIDHVVWNVAGLGIIVSDSLNIELQQPGVYDVAATAVSEHGCVSEAFFEEIAEVYPYPSAHFSLSSSSLTTLQPEVKFTNHSTGANSYFWNFSGLDTSTEESPTYSFPNENSENFTICLTAVNNNGCRDTTCRSIFMDADYVVFAPNAFTPDDDGDNDYWKPVIRGFNTKGYELSIFNRWGDRVFFTENPEEPWTGEVRDGDYFGQNEVYNWQLKLNVDDSTDGVYYTGSIVLIR